jgi:hypothetical protein
LDVFFFPESEGCLVALAVFKTVVAAQVARWVRFLSSPRIIFDFRFPIFDLFGDGGRFFQSKIEILGKGVTSMSREQIRKLTSLSSCAG